MIGSRSLARSTVAFLGACLVLAGCGGSQSGRSRSTRRSRQLAGSVSGQHNDRNRCDANAPNREVSEYDTSGDDRPDVRKVFLQAGTPPLLRLVLICREADLNGDGTKDVVRYYNDEGRPLREESDRDFDGQMDQVTYFENGRIVRVELDTTRDGRVDTKIFYDRGAPVRTERDLAGRSTENTWRADRWEYLEEGRMVRMGTDLDGDGRVDRWDRDQATVAQPDVGAAQEDESGGAEQQAQPQGTASPAPTSPPATTNAPVAPARSH